MKKILAIASSLLLATGIKAQTPKPIIKKETQKQPVLKPEAVIQPMDSAKKSPTYKDYKDQPMPTKIGHEGIKKIGSSHIKSPATKP